MAADRNTPPQRRHLYMPKRRCSPALECTAHFCTLNNCNGKPLMEDSSSFTSMTSPSSDNGDLSSCGLATTATATPSKSSSVLTKSILKITTQESSLQVNFHSKASPPTSLLGNKKRQRFGSVHTCAFPLRLGDHPETPVPVALDYRQTPMIACMSLDEHERTKTTLARGDASHLQWPLSERMAVLQQHHGFTRNKLQHQIVSCKRRQLRRSVRHLLAPMWLEPAILVKEQLTRRWFRRNLGGRRQKYGQ